MGLSKKRKRRLRAKARKLKKKVRRVASFVGKMLEVRSVIRAHRRASK
jgi:hypothetical protein